MQLLVSYLRPYWRYVLLALGLATVSQVFLLLDPLISRYLIDNYAVRHQEYATGEFLRGVTLLLLLALGAVVVSRFARSFQDYYVKVIAQRVGVDLYTDGIRHSLELPYALFEDQRSGETLGKLQKVRGDVQRLISISVNTLFTTLVGVVFVMVYSFTLHWLIAPAFLLTMVLLGFFSSALSRRIKRIQRVIVAETTALAGSTTESLRNIELVKALGLGRQENERLTATTHKILGLELDKVRALRFLTFWQAVSVNVVRGAVMLLMLYLVFSQRITVGQFFSLFLYSFFLFGPLNELGPVINTFRVAEASLETFEEILETPVEPRPVSPRSLGELASVRFEDVEFTHRTGTAPALAGVTFEIERGRTVAFVGPSGAGKTTLVKLLVGLYPTEPASTKPGAGGRVLYNGIPGADVDLDELRAQIGLVTQDTQLFSGSIRENLLFVNPEASDEECLEVLQKAACTSLLERAQRGLDTVIGEGGVKVSGGEKQRLSIARALLRRPRLLVFDEATSSLDSLTEEEITVTIRGLASQHLITVLIAHRLSTVMHADTIHVLEQGRIVESGGHADLLARKGLYYAMWRQQVGERRDPDQGAGPDSGQNPGPDSGQNPGQALSAAAE
jgi:ATP-binding cassette subfamily B protein